MSGSEDQLPEIKYHKSQECLFVICIGTIKYLLVADFQAY